MFIRIASRLALGAGILAVSSGSATFGAEPNNVPPSNVIEMIVAKVNGEIITRSELERSKKMLLDTIKANNVPPAEVPAKLAELEKDILREKIDQMLLVQKGKELSISVDNEVTKRIADIQRPIAKQNPELADPEKFQAYLREQTGMPYEDYRSEMKNSLLTRRVIGQEVSSKIIIPAADVKKFYEEHKQEFQREERVFLSEIFLATDGKDEKAKAEIEKKAKDLAARARKGEKFNELARDNSDAQTAQNEGQLPPYKKGELRKELEDKVWTQERNTIIDPISFPNGWLILKVEDHQQAGLASFEEVQGEITNKMYEPRINPAIRSYLTKLREEAFLEIRENYVDTGAAPGKVTKWTDPAQLKPQTIDKNEVASRKRRKRLLWAVPIPGTSTAAKGTSKSS